MDVKIKEIESMLKDNDITFKEFQNNLGMFYFRFDNNGKIVLPYIDVKNTISRILNERK
jgi:hypothetical protein